MQRWKKSFGIEYATLHEVLRNSDIVCLFASLTPETRHMIGHKELSLMKQSAFLINIARGELIDQEALLETLRKGQIAGAGLDVFEVEPLIALSALSLSIMSCSPRIRQDSPAGKSGSRVAGGAQCPGSSAGRLSQ